MGPKTMATSMPFFSGAKASNNMAPQKLCSRGWLDGLPDYRDLIS
jgi:hypothetical protein